MMLRAPGCHVEARNPCRRLLPLALLLATAGAATAQEGSRRLSFLPSASISETLTDNALLSDSNKRSDAITQLTAGITVLARTDRVRGSLDYQLSGSVHARETKANSTGQNLRSGLNAELIDDFFFLDAAAGITQQAISAFGLQQVNPAFDNPNRTEVVSLSVTPSLRGRIGTVAVYDARMSFTRQSSDAGTQGDQSGRNASLTVSSASGYRVGWNASVQRQISDFKNGRSTSNDRALIGLSYQPNPSVRLSANVGREESDITTLSKENNTTWGVGLVWIPSERTQLTATRDHRFFGDAHSVSLTHRMARTSWRFSSSRDLQTSLPGANTVLISAYDAFFDLFADEQPDPVLRRQLVLQRLQLLGIPETAVFASNFLTSAVTLVSGQDFSVGYQGLRTSAALTLHRSRTRRLDQASAVIDDLSTDPEVLQSGYSLTLGHRLTPIAGISLTASRQRSRGAQGGRSNDVSSLSLNWTSQLGRRSNVSLGARRVESDGSTTPYTENAIFATLGVRF